MPKINTATYQLSKHLSKVLSSMRASKHNMKSTKGLIQQIKKNPYQEDIKWCHLS